MIVEIPQGSRNKYEMDHETGEIWLDRTLFTATHNPSITASSPTRWAKTGIHSMR